MPKKYTDILANAFSEVHAWKLTSITLAALAMALALTLVWQSRSQSVILVPYGLATAKGPVKVAPGGDFSGSSADYLGQVAIGDVSLILNWQPDNVSLQYARFLNRTTSELYVRENARLLAEAKANRAAGTSQTFYPEAVQVDVKEGRVLVDGQLVRWTGDKEALRVKQRVIVSYRMQEGFLHVANVELAK